MDYAVSHVNKRSGMVVVLQKGFRGRGGTTMRPRLRMKGYAVLAGQHSRWASKYSSSMSYNQCMFYEVNATT
jgi:hypothetical protein